jgi:hypothetical protein
VVVNNSIALSSTGTVHPGSAPDRAAFWTIVVISWTIYATSGCYRLTPYNAHVYVTYSMLHDRFDQIRAPGYFELI